MGKVRWCEFDKDGYRHVEEIHEVVVHRFTMGDVEDPDLYAGQPISEWQESAPGKFVMEHAVETPVWHRHADPVNWGHQYIIVAELEKKKLAEFYLKWENPNGNSTLW